MVPQQAGESALHQFDTDAVGCGDITQPPPPDPFLRIQVIIESDNGTPELVQDVAHLEREELQPETLGLTLAEGKPLLEGVQRTLVTQQTAAYLAQQALYPQCQTPRHRKGTRPIAYRTLFGTLRLPNDRCEVSANRLHGFGRFKALGRMA
jgi:hypothetical protein